MDALFLWGNDKRGIVALIWATAAINYFGGPDGLNAAAAAGKTPAIMVNEICNSCLGNSVPAIAIVGVVILSGHFR